MKTTAFWKQLVVSCVLIIGAGLTWQFRAELTDYFIASAGDAKSASARQDRTIGTPVIVAKTTSLRDDQRFSAIGTGLAFRSVTLRAPSSGEITMLSAASGRRFAQGETLMRLEDADERFTLTLAEARLDRAMDERDRYMRLENSGVAATVRFQEAQTSFKVVQIELEQARDMLDGRILRAPFDGIPGFASVEIGDRIAAGDPVASFDDRSRILVEFDLPEALLGRVSVGLPVLADTPSAAGRSFDGEISAIDSRVSAATRTARVRASIDNSEDLLRPGASFALQLDIPGETFPAVPELALQFSQGSLHVWRVADGTAEKVPVRLVRRSAGTVIVDGPLQQGDRVVVEGTQRLRPGAAVQVLNTPTEPSS